MVTSFTGPHGVGFVQAKIIASGLRLYAKTGMKPSRAYTPANMLAAAARLTGKTFKRGQYEEAAKALDALAEVEGAKARELGQIK